MRHEEWQQSWESEILHFQGCSCDAHIKTRTSGSQRAECGLRGELRVLRLLVPGLSHGKSSLLGWALPALSQSMPSTFLCSCSPSSWFQNAFGFAQFTWDLFRPRFFFFFFKVCELKKMSQSGIPCEQDHCEFGLFICFLNNVDFFSPPNGFPARKPNRKISVSHTIILPKRQILLELPGAINSH